MFSSHSSILSSHIPSMIWYLFVILIFLLTFFRWNLQTLLLIFLRLISMRELVNSNQVKSIYSRSRLSRLWYLFDFDWSYFNVSTNYSCCLKSNIFVAARCLIFPKLYHWRDEKTCPLQYRELQTFSRDWTQQRCWDVVIRQFFHWHKSTFKISNHSNAKE